MFNKDELETILEILSQWLLSNDNQKIDNIPTAYTVLEVINKILELIQGSKERESTMILTKEDQEELLDLLKYATIDPYFLIDYNEEPYKGYVGYWCITRMKWIERLEENKEV